MSNITQNSIRLSAPYRKTIGKVTFQVSAFGNLNGTETAQKMIIRLLERSAAEYQLCTEKEGEGA